MVFRFDPCQALQVSINIDIEQPVGLLFFAALVHRLCDSHYFIFQILLSLDTLINTEHFFYECDLLFELADILLGVSIS